MYERRLAWRLFVTYFVVALFALAALGWYGSHLIAEAMAGALSRQLETTARLVAQRVGPLFSPVDQRAIQAIVDEAGGIDGTRITVILDTGQVVADTDEDPAQMDNHASRPEVKAALAGERRLVDRFSTTVRERHIYLAVPIVQNNRVLGVTRTSIPRSENSRESRRYQGLLLTGLIVAAIVAAAACWLLALRHSRPFEQVAAAAIRLADGEGAERLPRSNVLELARLSEALNQMALKLEERTHTIGRKGHEQEAILASMVEGVLAVDSDERVISINRAAAELIGVSAAAALGRNLQEVVRNADLREFATRARTSDEAVEDDLLLRGEEERVLQIRGAALRDVRGRSIGAVIVLHDITNYRQLENVRRDFVANVSHELKTPIASIKGFVETLLDGASQDPQDAERFLRIVAKQADRLNSIIEDLLSLAKIEQSKEETSLPLSTGNIKAVLEAAVYDCQTTAAERNVNVAIVCDEAIVADINAHLLEQAVVNLLDNAIKYSDPGDEVLVKVQTTPSEVQIVVADQGCGIDKDHLPRLFERFYRVDRARSRKLGGTGLGLAIVKHIVLAHGGKVTVESTPGVGSTFTIHLPAVKRSPAAIS
jgi:two-component system phosphate regulon sensor histidine kinase PhoR